MSVIIDPDPTLQNNLMALGFECDEGWNLLIKELIRVLNELCPEDEINVLQVKEKYGSLRFYVSGASDRALRIIDHFEWMSNYVCECCGAFWATNKADNGWYKTLCDSCREKLNKDSTE